MIVIIQKFQPLFAISLASIILKEKLSRRFIGITLVSILGGYLVTFGTNGITDWD